ncbi:uncharacterized protein LOC144144944 [Haemaphysalis longicornis]
MVIQQRRRFSRRNIRIWGRALFMVFFSVYRAFDALAMMNLESPLFVVMFAAVVGSSGMLLVLYDGLYSAVLMAFAEIFTAYLRHEVNALKKVPEEASSAMATRMLTDHRVNFNEIQELVKAANHTMRYSLLMAYGWSLLILCNTIYFAVDTVQVPWSLRVFALLYGLIMWLDMMDTGVSAEAMNSHGSKMKRLLESMPLRGFPNSFGKQVRFFHDVVNDSALHFSASGFFRLSLAQLLSVGNTIITYAVIVVQTRSQVDP